MTPLQTPPFPAIRLISRWQGVLAKFPGLELATAQVLLALKAGQWINSDDQLERLSKVSRMGMANTSRLLTCLHELDWVAYRRHRKGQVVLDLTEEGEQIVAALLAAMDDCRESALP